MRSKVLILTLLLMWLPSCSLQLSGEVPPTLEVVTYPPQGRTPEATPLPSETATASPVLPSETVQAATLTASPTSSPEVILPTSTPADIDPLTGQKVDNPALLARRPLAIKVENLPRSDRPQWGLSLADLVFEYYTERGTTRFIPVFYGRDASRVGPIRSARFFDIYVVEGYKAVFAYGYAYVAEQSRLTASDFANRLVIQGPGTPLYNPPGSDAVVVGTSELSAYITKKGVENGRQDLSGMSFNMIPPPGGQAVRRIYVRYSAAIYNRWDYDPTTARYRRFVDAVDDFTGGLGEKYVAASDRLNHESLTFDNLVVLYVPHNLTAPDIYDIPLLGTGPAYIFRDGQVYSVSWQRTEHGVLTLADSSGQPFPFKPGTTWFEVVNTSATLDQTQSSWRFTQHIED